MLDDFGKAIEALWDLGYKIVEPNDYKRVTKRRIKMSAKQARQAAKIAENAPIDLITVEVDRKEMIAMAALTKTVSHFMEKALKQTKSIEKKKENPKLVEAEGSIDIAD